MDSRVCRHVQRGNELFRVLSENEIVGGMKVSCLVVIIITPWMLKDVSSSTVSDIFNKTLFMEKYG